MNPILSKKKKQLSIGELIRNHNFGKLNTMEMFKDLD